MYKGYTFVNVPSREKGWVKVYNLLINSFKNGYNGSKKIKREHKIIKINKKLIGNGKKGSNI
jgi:hypothetical protein